MLPASAAGSSCQTRFRRGSPWRTDKFPAIRVSDGRGCRRTQIHTATLGTWRFGSVPGALPGSDILTPAARPWRRSAGPGAYACVDTWLTDFRQDLPKIDVPTLVVHGTADRILPFDATAKRLPGLIKNVRLVTVEGGPHNIAWTHPDEVNKALLEFLAD